VNSSTFGRDWFIGAIEAHGSVRQCLQALCNELDFKKKFVLSLIDTLHKSEDSKVDDLTHLHQQVRQLRQTLSVRISLLSAERETPWFRRSLTHNVGPFTGAILQEPVFFFYDPKNTDRLKEQLGLSFNTAQNGPLDLWSQTGQKALEAGDHCLWTRLLSYNCRLKAHGSITLSSDLFSSKSHEPYTLNIEDVSDLSQLPYILESRPLRAFLLNIQTELRSIKALLQECFDILYNASTSFWSAQKKHQSANPQNKNQSFASNEKTHFAAPVKLLPIEQDSLRFMGFSTLPNQQDLRQKYRELAKKMHPDLHQGQDAAFKKLVESYQILQKKISKDI
jgi:hypothetical protein